MSKADKNRPIPGIGFRVTDNSYLVLTTGGTYSTTNGSTSVNLTKQEDNRSWELPHSRRRRASGVLNVFVKPNEQNDACINSAMARKRSDEIQQYSAQKSC